MYIRKIGAVSSNLFLKSSGKQIVTKLGACHVLEHEHLIVLPGSFVARLEYQDSLNRALVAGEREVKETAALLQTHIPISDDYQLERWQISLNHSSFMLLTNVCEEFLRRPIVTSSELEVHIPLNGSFLLSPGDSITLAEGQCRVNFDVKMTYLPSDITPNKIIRCPQTQDKYRITERQLGKGGFGGVFLAFNITKRRQVACKVIERCFMAKSPNDRQTREDRYSDGTLTQEYCLLSNLGKHV
jgi:hypothetical protein